MKNIYTYVAKVGYAARVQDTKSYDAIRFASHVSSLCRSSRVLYLARIYYLDGRSLLSLTTITQARTHTNTEEGIDISPGTTPLSYHGKFFCLSSRSNLLTGHRTCTVGTNTLIGSHSQIFDNVVITSSVIGRRCKILPRARITNSYIFDDTTIEADCVVTNSIIGSMSLIKEGTTVEKGCLIADDVTIGPKGLVKEFERVSKKPKKPQVASEADDEDSELEEVSAGKYSLAEGLVYR